jgi:AcrR family transcriptional regulator
MPRRTAARRKPAAYGERRALIVDAARRVFAEYGFATSTREIADAIGVAQPLLYKYFPSKDDLIEAVFTDRYEADNFAPPPEILEDESETLEARLTEFYSVFVGQPGGEFVRLFLRGALDKIPVALMYRSTLNERVLKPVIAAFRRDVGAPAFAKKPMMEKEREAALVLHASVIFLVIRTYVYDAPSQLGFNAALSLAVRTNTAGIRTLFREWHG